LKPIVKWAGGKRKLFPQLKPLFPESIQNPLPNGGYIYSEPFTGGGGIFCSIQPHVAILNDANYDLIDTYRTVKDDVDSVLSELALFENTPECYYEVRGWDRYPAEYHLRNSASRAARFLYLNKTCYNGLYRVNRSGHFNTPFGKYKSPDFLNASGLLAFSRYLNQNKVSLLCGDFERAVVNPSPKIFAYFDPPYDPVSKTASFTHYTENSFSQADQIRLRNFCDFLSSAGAKFMVSNSDTAFVRDVWRDYRINTVQANRAINSIGHQRGPVSELVIRNYDH
jgi:DNA adenine methylase